LFPRSTIFNGEAYAGWQRDCSREVHIVSGCFLMIPRAFWEMLGGFDDSFFMYGEEADLCLRARALGARPMFTPAATIVHHGGASERTRVGKMVKLLAAKTLLINRHWRPSLRPLGRGLLQAWPLSRWLALALLAAATGSRTAREKAEAWQAIWSLRGEWQGGYRDNSVHVSPASPLTVSAGGG
jgi:GT2 family glycosyltransferase